MAPLKIQLPRKEWLNFEFKEIKLFGFLKPAPFAPQIQNPKSVDQSYRHWRLRISYSIFLGYAVFYLTRKSFTFAMPFIEADLGFTKVQLGFLASILYISYGISKFLGGILSDKSNPRFFMALGLIFTGICNICFGFSSSLWLFAVFWGLNGFFQAWGWPACTKTLTFWFAKSERGLWYSVCSTSHNVGGALIPLLAAWSAYHFGWRWAMFIPAGISIVMGLFLINRLRDVPQSMGLPPVEEYKNKDKQHIPSSGPAKAPPELSVKEILFKEVLNNKFVWILSISYFFVYVVRTGVNDWGAFFLIEVKHYDHLLASSGISWFEMGGFLGMILAGWGSDYFFKGKRVPCNIIAAAGLALSVLAFWWLPQGTVVLDMVCLALIGAFVFGPQMLVGLAAAEFVDKRAAATSNGFAGTLGYLGAAMAGAPIGYIIEHFSWDGYFLAMFACSGIVFITLLPFWSATSKEKSSPLWTVSNPQPSAEKG